MHALFLAVQSNGTGMAVSDERVDYVVVDQERTQALKNTREAWYDGRQSTENDTPSKGPKWNLGHVSFPDALGWRWAAVQE